MRHLSLDQIIQHIDQTRGRRRERTLHTEDLLQALDEARRDDYGLRAGATVANCYGYPAHRMRLVAIRTASGDYAVMIDWATAKRGCSPCPLGGQAKVWERTLAAERQRLTHDAWLVIPGAEVQRALAGRRAQARRAREAQWPESECPAITVSATDSIAAGNCERETQRIAGWWPAGTTEIDARELRREILRREPTLTEYARRAVEAAARRLAQAV